MEFLLGSERHWQVHQLKSGYGELPTEIGTVHTTPSTMGTMEPIFSKPPPKRSRAAPKILRWWDLEGSRTAITQPWFIFRALILAWSTGARAPAY